MRQSRLEYSQANRSRGERQMATLSRLRPIVLVFTTVAAVVSLGAMPAVAGAAGPARAETTWTVDPGGAVTGTGDKTTLTDTKTKTDLTCKASAAMATLKKGAGQDGSGLGKITSLTFGTCTGPLNLTFEVKTNASDATPWLLNAKDYDADTGVTTGTITGIHATLTGEDCAATVDGTDATKNNGEVEFTYSNKNAHLVILPKAPGVILPKGPGLKIYNVTGCLGLIHSGDRAVFDGIYSIKPAQKITSS
jgi:hypothetical protein